MFHKNKASHFVFCLIIQKIWRVFDMCTVFNVVYAKCIEGKL